MHQLETLISQLEDLDRAKSLMASLSWSFAMAVGHMTARIARDEGDDPERIKLLEQRRDELGDVLGWAARQANPEYLPSGETIVARIIEPGTQPELPEDIIAHMAQTMDVPLDALRKAQARSAERMAEEQSLQAEAAKLHRREIVTAINSAMYSYPGNELRIKPLDQIKIVDRTAEKSAQYAENTLAAAMRQRRDSRRATFVAEWRLLKDIEHSADELLTHLRHEFEATQRDEPQVA